MTNWKGFRRKRSWSNFKVLFQHSPWGTEEKHKKLSQDSRSPGQDRNPGPPEYEVGLLATQPRRSVIFDKTHLKKDLPIIRKVTYREWSRSSSVSIVSGYGLEDRAIEVRSAAEQEIFSSNLLVQTGSGAHPSSCPMGTGVKGRRGVKLSTHPI
jgi:hypothetical protein